MILLSMFFLFFIICSMTFIRFHAFDCLLFIIFNVAALPEHNEHNFLVGIIFFCMWKMENGKFK